MADPKGQEASSRRILALGLVGWITIVGACPASARSPAEAVLAELTVRQKLAQLLMVRFVGPVSTPAIAAMIQDQGAGAVVLYAEPTGNLVSEAQVRTLTRGLQARSKIPLVIAVDQEGGRVDRLAKVRGPRPGAAEIAASGDLLRAAAEGARDAIDLARLGIQLNLAPVVDVGRVANPQLAKRIFGDRPEQVTRFAGAYLEALQRGAKVAGTLKHFPGMGAVATDPHIAMSRLALGDEEIRAIDWAPYRDLFRDGDVHAVMVTHVIVDALDADRPASISSAVITDGLRRTLGFEGVVIADALTMPGVSKQAALADAALESLRAGADWLIGPRDLPSTIAVLDRLEQAVIDGTLSAIRLDEATLRVLRLKQWLGLLASTPAAEG